MKRHEWLELKNWAVLGASTKEESYGRRITEKLAGEGYTVIPVSPKYPSVAGVTCVKSLTDYEGPVDVVDFVVNPTIGIELLDDVIAKGVKKILLQPGSESDALIEKAKAAGIEVLESCVLVLLSWR